MTLGGDRVRGSGLWRVDYCILGSGRRRPLRGMTERWQWAHLTEDRCLERTGGTAEEGEDTRRKWSGETEKMRKGGRGALMLVGWRLEEFAGQVWAPWKQGRRYQAGPVDTRRVGTNRSQAGRSNECRQEQCRQERWRLAAVAQVCTGDAAMPWTGLATGCGLLPAGV